MPMASEAPQVAFNARPFRHLLSRSGLDNAAARTAVVDLLEIVIMISMRRVHQQLLAVAGSGENWYSRCRCCLGMKVLARLWRAEPRMKHNFISSTPRNIHFHNDDKIFTCCRTPQQGTELGCLLVFPYKDIPRLKAAVGFDPSGT